MLRLPKCGRSSLQSVGWRYDHDPGQQPNDDLAHAISVLNIVALTLEDGRPLSASSAHDVLVTIDIARDIMRPIVRFLDKIDYPGIGSEYCKARVAELEARSALTGGGVE